MGWGSETGALCPFGARSSELWFWLAQVGMILQARFMRTERGPPHEADWLNAAVYQPVLMGRVESGPLRMSMQRTSCCVSEVEDVRREQCNNASMSGYGLLMLSNNA